MVDLIYNDGIKWRGYSYKSLNLDGDINVDLYNIVNKFSTYPNIDKVVSEHFLKTYKKINKLIKSNNAQLIITHPVTFNTDLYNLYMDKDKDRINKFTDNFLQKHNIEIKCNPLLFHLSMEYSFDTRHHSNRYGALLRTSNLAYCMKRIFDGTYKKISYNKAFKQTKKLEDKYNEVTKKNILNKLEHTCLPKEKISFKSSKVLFQGWSHIEKKFRWSLNNNAKIIFKMNNKDLVGILNLHILTLGKQDIKIIINKHYIGTKTINSRDTVLKLKFNPSVFQDNINTIEFEFSNPHIPNSKDKRMLAMGLKSFSVE